MYYRGQGIWDATNMSAKCLSSGEEPTTQYRNRRSGDMYMAELGQRVLKIEGTLPKLATKVDISDLKKELLPMGKDAAKWQLVKSLFTSWSGRVCLITILLAFTMAGQQMIDFLTKVVK